MEAQRGYAVEAQRGYAVEAQRGDAVEAQRGDAVEAQQEGLEGGRNSTNPPEDGVCVVDFDFP